MRGSGRRARGRGHYLGFVVLLMCLMGESGRIAGQPGGNPAGGRVLVSLPAAPYDALVEPLRGHLRRATQSGSTAPVDSGELIVGTIGPDPGAWAQSASLVRASLWFLMGRQALAAHVDAQVLRAFEQTRDVIRESDLLVRAPLLASISLISGRILLERSEPDAATARFRAAAVFDPDDQSELVPEGPARIHYQAARQWVIDAQRLPVRVQVSSPGATLIIDGSRVNGEGPDWLVELPPGEHHVVATREGAIPDATSLKLESGAERPRVRLNVEKGSTCAACARPFSLAEATAVQARIREVLAERGASEAYVQCFVRPVRGAQGARPAPKVGVQGGFRVNPGPDAGEEAASPGPVEVEIFRVDSSGTVSWIGGGQAGEGG